MVSLVTVRRDAKQGADAAKYTIVRSLCTRINKIKDDNDGVIKYGFITKLITATIDAVPQFKITRHSIRYMMAKLAKEAAEQQANKLGSGAEQAEQKVVPPGCDQQNGRESLLASSLRKPGGRPEGATAAKSNNKLDSFVAARNDIATLFLLQMKRAKSKNKRMRKGVFDKIVKKVKSDRNLPDDFSASRDMIRKRVARNNTLVMNRNGSGQVSPLLQAESQFVAVLTQMSRIGDPLTPSCAIALINDLISGTKYQNCLEEFKRKHCGQTEKEKLGKIGYKYWTNFKGRNAHLIVTRKGQKFELDRSQWTTYTNFWAMYNRFGDEMEYASVAQLFDEPQWMDREGTICQNEELAFGCKVTHNILRSDMILVMDEVGSDTSQKGDGAIGGEKFVCEKGTTPKENCSTKSKHWTLIGLTALDGTPVMCIIIFKGEQESTIHATGMDLFVEVEGNESEHDFFAKNSGPGKLYPGGPQCMFKGKMVPCMCRWTPKGGINGSILLDIIATLDALCVFDEDMKAGVKPMLLLDAHGSHFELPFLQYINDTNTEWVVCIGVPYGTSLWQVGDSSEQNGSYKMACAKFKRRLFKMKRDRGMSPGIHSFEVMLIVNYALTQSFARKDKNKMAISERGWYPYNRKLLTYSTLRATMTDEDRTKESETITIPKSILNPTLDLTDDTPHFDPQYLSSGATEPKPLNFSNGMSAWCLDTMVGEADRNAARQRNKTQLNEGKSLEEKMKGWTKCTGGKLFQAGEVRLGQDVLTKVQANKTKRHAEERTKEKKAAEDYLQLVSNADRVKAMMSTTGTEVNKLKNADLRA